MACSFSPSYSGGWGRIAWTQQVETAVSWDCTTALQTRQQREAPSQKRKKRKRKNYWICGFIVFNQFGKLSAIFLQIIFSLTCRFGNSSYRYTRPLEDVLQNTDIPSLLPSLSPLLPSFLSFILVYLHIFSLCVYVWIASINMLSRSPFCFLFSFGNS